MRLWAIPTANVSIANFQEHYVLFVDRFLDFSRFKTLQPVLQLCLLYNLFFFSFYFDCYEALSLS